MKHKLIIILIIFFVLFVNPMNSSESANTVSTKAERDIMVKNMKTKILKENRIKLNLGNYLKFTDALGMRESGNDYQNDNNMPYWGKYQIGPLVRETLKIDLSWKQFSKDSIYQDAILLKNFKYNERVITKKYLNYFIGRKINGIVVTYSGILASAHIAGGGGVRRYLYSGGGYNPKDKFNTHISDYMKEFSGYEFSLENIKI